MRSASIQKKMQAYVAVREAIGSNLLGEFYQSIMQAVYNALLFPGASALDCGAYVGHHTVAMAEVVGPAGHVDAFEPIPEVVELLDAALSRCGVRNEVTIHETALGSVTGETAFTVVYGAMGRSGIRQRPVTGALAETVRFDEISVKLERLDDVIPASQQVTFAKFNLQGGEFDALRGGEELLRRCRPVIAIENGRAESAQLYDYTPEEFFSFLEDIDFRLCDCLGYELDLLDWTVGGQPWIQFLIPAERTDLDAVVSRVIDRELRAKGILSLVA